ncbi:hypothetical protein JKP88DRAFT_198306 [Tribonema minus]|uniref:DUF547 domain-containing protein n=1 Tax=Tribonema minus TaxID=303371 RepID=A0A835Z374_9STRA|nr:hypothetical protein JKP88DRAFT_198306 [Tribonema minus]
MRLAGAAKGQVLGPLWLSKRILNKPQPGTTEDAAAAAATADSSSAVAQNMNSSTKTLYTSFLAEDGSGVDYASLAASPEYAQYLRQAATLSAVNLSDMPPAERKAFFLNTYNALVIHAFVAIGTPRWLLGRLAFYATAAYDIGGAAWCLNDIENGALRGNRRSAAPFTGPPLARDDARLPLCLELDPRIHFALNCGALSCPPIRHYSAEGLDAQLDLATRAFVNGMALNDAGDALLLSQIFRWYAADFGGSDAEVLAWIRQYVTAPAKAAALDKQLSRAPVVCAYEAYDWSLNQKK